jgi:Tol biopolymer transport system component/DNA-binding winged helix-turn-helix (wHTH) protein
MQSEHHPVRVAFGTFEADLSTGELWRGGFRIKLQGQPFRVLTELVHHAGHVVTREELQQRVWDKGTNVDFDHSLGTAINKIREALNDSAENPRFVETLPRRGYRFIAPVTVLEAHAPLQQEASIVEPPAEVVPVAVPASIERSVTAVPASEIVAPLLTTPETKHRVLRFGAIAAACVALILMTTLGYGIATYKNPPVVPTIRQLTHTQRFLPGSDATESFAAIATDGLHVFASVLRDGRVHLERITIAGGTSEDITLPDEVAGPAIADMSRDGYRLLVRSHATNQSEQPLFIVPGTGGSAQRVVHVLAHDATWMPDNSRILYAAGNDLYETDPTGGDPVHYASLPGRAFWLRWSPDAKVLRFTLFDPLSHRQTLWELQANNRKPHPLLGSWAQSRDVCCGNWAPDGSAFVFQATEGSASDLWRISGLSDTPQRLTDGPLAYQGPLFATKDSIYMTGVATEGEVQIMPPGMRSFSSYHGIYSNAHRLEQTRDGRWLAWVDTEGRLWRARPDGSELLQLTPAELQVFSAHWSPDGSRLAMMARMSSGAWSIYQVLADGSELQRVLEAQTNAADPTWSPDGQQLAFGQTPDLLGKDAAPRTIQTLDLKTHKLTVIPQSDGLFSPRWSPDGRYIAALSLDQKQLRLYDTQAKQWSTLTTRSVADPVWSDDSQFIYADAFVEPGQPVYRVRVQNSQMEEMGGIGNMRSTDFSDLVFCGLLHDGTVVVRGRLNTANLYSLHLGSPKK